jgi:hypothetical protein
MSGQRCRWLVRPSIAVGIVAVLAFLPGAAAAQTPPTDPNQGALTFSAALDLPSSYFFRGIRQEGEPKLTLWPAFDAAARIHSADGVRVSVNLGMWNSLHTGTAGTGGPEQKLQYEQDFSVGVTLELAGRMRVSPSFTAYTSPNRSFDTIKEADLRIVEVGRWAPYALLAFELSDDGQRDNGSRKGRYLEIGVVPHWALPLRSLVLSVPVKAGFSLGNYYELLGSDLAFHDNRFGFVDAGGLLTVPLTTSPTRFGTWLLRGGAEAMRLGTTTEALNKGKRTAVVALVGVGVVY